MSDEQRTPSVDEVMDEATRMVNAAQTPLQVSALTFLLARAWSEGHASAPGAENPYIG